MKLNTNIGEVVLKNNLELREFSFSPALIIMQRKILKIIKRSFMFQLMAAPVE